ncbi:hypothetical protein [Psychroserpens sp.]|uniref:hypothetical protein n=1 Tax=Psychroserpens sp. TaxID=2020870 RepID=UPI002B274CEA|nr:hypothetical protein [Psychroserpens sp.]
MEDKIDITLEYYLVKQKQILNFMNTNDSLTVDDIIHYGQEMSVIENKITALEVALEN